MSNAMEIDFTQYLSEDEIKDTVKSAIYNRAKEWLGSATFSHDRDFERIFNNCAYHVIYDLVNERVNGNIETIIADKVIEYLNKDDCLSPFYIFREGSSWEKQSEASKIVERCVRANTDLIEEKVINTLKSLDRKTVRDALTTILSEKLIKKN